MSVVEEALQCLARIPLLQVTRNEPLSRHARFEFGGPALLFADTEDEGAFVAALSLVQDIPLPWAVIGGGTNLIVSDSGYRGIVLRYRGAAIRRDGNRIIAESGAVLQDLVDFAITEGLKGLETMTGIPGFVGAAVYGNAGAYGRSMSDMVVGVRYFDGEQVRGTGREGCEFRYRSSIFKARKGWLILSCELEMAEGESRDLANTAGGIREVRDRKYPPTMACAGSIFKNQILDRLPESARAAVPPGIVKGGKVPSAWFLEQVGAKGLGNGGIRVTGYHANTVYNAGGGTALQFCELIAELKSRVRRRYGFELEEEVQYMGFDQNLPGLDQLRATAFIIQGMLAALKPDQIMWKAAPERWSIREVLAHLDDSDRTCFLPRVVRVMTEDDPEVLAYKVENAPQAEGGFALATLESFLQARHASVEYLESVPVDALERTARHSEAGSITLAQILNHWAFHDLGHIRQIAEIVRAIGYYPEMGSLQSGYTVKP